MVRIERVRIRRGRAVEAHPPRPPSPRALGGVGPGEEVPDELAEQPLAPLEAHEVRVVADEVLAQIVRVGEEHLSVVPEVVEVLVVLLTQRVLRGREARKLRERVPRGQQKSF